MTELSGDARELGRWGVAIAAAILAIWAVMATPVLETPWPLAAALLGIALSCALVFTLQLDSSRNFLIIWAVAAAGVGIFSAVTGLWNGQTEEPYTTPAFVQLFPNLYGGVLRLTYSGYGSPPQTVISPYVYLPLLPLIQVPGTSYRFLSLAAWAGTVALVRQRGRAVVLLGHPWLALLAANGFNDFVPLLLLTLFYTTPPGAKSRLWEVAALAVKQFANAIVVAYYLVQRRWREAGIAVAITLAVILPFFLLDPVGTECHALLIDWYPGCSGASSGGPFASPHTNYAAWPVWVVAMWGGGIWAWVAAPPRLGRFLPRRWRPGSERPASGAATTERAPPTGSGIKPG